MLALNVSADILNGFKLVNNSLKTTLGTATVRNAGLYKDFDYLNAQNPKKVGEWLNKAKAVKKESDELYNYIEDVKVRIAKAADGPEGKPDSLIAAGNLDSPGEVGLVGGRGIVLKKMLAKYSTTIQGLVDSPAQKANIKKLYDTPSKNGEPWEFQVFEMMPAAATVTILSKYQNDIRNSEAEIVQYLKAQVDASDYRVNEIKAIVIPNSKYVIRGGKYSAQIALAATDSTKKPIVKVNGSVVKNGLYEVGCGATGAFTYSGVIELPKSDGTVIPYKFTSDYTVGEPAVTVSADLMNVFYAGIGNPISISVPGVPASKIKATMNGGSLDRTAKGWIAKPSRVGQECVISVSAEIDGKTQTIGAKAFRVKALPPPIAFVEYKEGGNAMKYKGSVPFSKARLIEATGIKAELDDADLDVKYNVLGFEVNFFDSMGNTIIELSNGSQFSERQMVQMRKITKGKKFYISRVKAKGPDNIERILPPIEVIVN
jgi:gliding motility-associated protein GldM